MIVGPWICEQCKQLSQYADKTPTKNIVFCKNCGYGRIVDKRDHVIVENDQTVWKYDGNGNKVRIRGR